MALKIKTERRKAEKVKTKMKNNNMSQWASQNGAFFSIGETKNTLPSGAYKPVVTPQGLMLQSVEMHGDGLVVLPTSPSAMVIKRIREFWAAKDTFAALGLLHKRGALLYGPPGSGKTAAITILCRDMLQDGGVVLVNPEQPKILSLALKMIRSVEMDRPIVCVLEDVETQLRWEEELLAVLDGQDQVGGIVFLATTNNIDKLPGRLMNRPSRFDEVVLIGMPDDETRRTYVRSRVPVEMLSDSELTHWIAQTDGLSIAHMRELVVAVVALKQPLEEAVARLNGMTLIAESKDDAVDSLMTKIQPHLYQECGCDETGCERCQDDAKLLADLRADVQALTSKGGK